MQTFIGNVIPDDMFKFFAELNAYKCCLCNHTYIEGMIETDTISGVQVVCSSVVDKYGRPIGLVCSKCEPKFTQFIYRSDK